MIGILVPVKNDIFNGKMPGFIHESSRKNRAGLNI